MRFGISALDSIWDSLETLLNAVLRMGSKSVEPSSTARPSMLKTYNLTRETVDLIDTYMFTLQSTSDCAAANIEPARIRAAEETLAIAVLQLADALSKLAESLGQRHPQSRYSYYQRLSASHQTQRWVGYSQHLQDEFLRFFSDRRADADTDSMSLLSSRSPHLWRQLRVLLPDGHSLEHPEQLILQAEEVQRFLAGVADWIAEQGDIADAPADDSQSSRSEKIGGKKARSAKHKKTKKATKAERKKMKKAAKSAHRKGKKK